VTFERLNVQPLPGFEAVEGLEGLDFDASFTQMRQARVETPLRPMPLVVLSHGRPEELPPDLPSEAIEQVWQELQADLATLVPDAQQVITIESGHDIQHEQPELVIEAVRQVVKAVRHRSR
jgi:hypothetical protein